MTVNLAATADRPYTGCSGLPASPADFQRLYGTPEAKAAAARAWGLPAPAGFATIGQQYLELAGGWRDAWRTELRGPRGEWVKGNTEALSLHKLASIAATPFVGAELPDTLTRAEKTALSHRVGAFTNAAGAKVPAMFGPGEHLDYDGKPPTLFNENEVEHAGNLADLDWNGHMLMSNAAAEDIRDILDHPDQPVNTPNAPVIPLHELIHAAVPAGQHRNTNGDKQAYNDSFYGGAQANIEEGFTQLGTTQHAGEFLRQAGLADRLTPVIDDTTQQPITMAEYARRASCPGEHQGRAGWGMYKDLTAKAFEWVSLIAQQHTGKPETDPATAREIQRLSDEVNAVGHGSQAAGDGPARGSRHAPRAAV